MNQWDYLHSTMAPKSKDLLPVLSRGRIKACWAEARIGLMVSGVRRFKVDSTWILRFSALCSRLIVMLYWEDISVRTRLRPELYKLGMFLDWWWMWWCEQRLAVWIWFVQMNKVMDVPPKRKSSTFGSHGHIVHRRSSQTCENFFFFGHSCCRPLIHFDLQLVDIVMWLVLAFSKSLGTVVWVLVLLVSAATPTPMFLLLVCKLFTRPQISKDTGIAQRIIFKSTLNQLWF